MADLPLCPNFLKRDGTCDRSELRLLGEGPQAFSFMCNCCQLLWMVSKPKTKEAAKYFNQIDKVKKATEEERERARRPLLFYNNYEATR